MIAAKEPSNYQPAARRWLTLADQFLDVRECAWTLYRMMLPDNSNRIDSHGVMP